MRTLEQLQPPVAVYVRVALAAAFLSAVADRFGLWGPFGTPNVAWGPEPPLAYSVWSALAGAALLATLPEPAFIWSLDHWLHRDSTRRESSAIRGNA